VVREYASRTPGRAVRHFTRYLDEHGVTHLGAIRPEAIQGFITSLGGRYQRKTTSQFCSILRGFLRFLYRQGITSRDLSPLVTGPRLFRHEECPRFLTGLGDAEGALDRGSTDAAGAAGLPPVFAGMWIWTVASFSSARPSSTRAVWSRLAQEWATSSGVILTPDTRCCNLSTTKIPLFVTLWRRPLNQRTIGPIFRQLLTTVRH